MEYNEKEVAKEIIDSFDAYDILLERIEDAIKKYGTSARSYINMARYLVENELVPKVFIERIVESAIEKEYNKVAIDSNGNSIFIDDKTQKNFTSRLYDEYKEVFNFVDIKFTLKDK